MKVMLFALPIFARRISERQKTLLDVGSGPTVYVAMCFRGLADEIFLSDFADSSRNELNKWLRKQEPYFDWAPVAKSIAFSEGDPNNWENIDEETRNKIRGIFFCDVTRKHILPEIPESETFDIVTSIFCLESACMDYSEYCNAMKNTVRTVKPGGYFVLGSVVEETSYDFGGDNNFHLLHLTTKQIVDAMEEAGIDTTHPKSFRSMFFDSASVFMGKKRDV